MDQRGHFQRRKNRAAFGRLRKFGEIYFRRLFQIGLSLLKCLALGGRARLRIMGHKPSAIRVGMDDRREILRFLFRLHCSKIYWMLFYGPMPLGHAKSLPKNIFRTVKTGSNKS